MRSVLTILSLGLLAIRAIAADSPPLPTTRDGFLDPLQVWDIHLRITPADWASMEPKGDRGFGPPPGPRPDGRPPDPGADFRPRPGQPLMPPGEADYPWATAEVRVNGVVFTNVGIRFKGNSSFNMSRNSRKRPFKLDFDRNAKGRKLAGLEELFLNNNANDPSGLRETLAYAAFRRAGLPAPRTSYVRVTLEGVSPTPEFLGLYTAVEPIEGDFLEQHFGTRKGLLVKPERLRGLEYLGDDWAVYTNRYQPRSKVQAADARRFISNLRSITRASDATYSDALTNALDADGLLRFVAVNAWLANYDSMLGTGHNYHLFQSSAEGRIRFIPWDLNEAFGRHPGAGDGHAQAACSVLRPHVDPNPFLDRLLRRPEWAARYRRIVEEIHSGACSTNALLADHARVSEVIRPHVTGGRQFQPPGGFGPGRPGGGPPPVIPVPEWILERHRNVSAELDGSREAPRVQMQRRGGPPRPPEATGR